MKVLAIFTIIFAVVALLAWLVQALCAKAGYDKVANYCKWTKWVAAAATVIFSVTGTLVAAFM